ncbi:DivIVA domain-containing protein [Gardnerella vaginalis]|uniref:DivIVA domain-containing protein n=1 Tax=Gardnerella vaginalis TaxID=2702 RepID=UPI0039EE6DD7
MASKPDTARNSSGIERVGKRKKGYSVEQVNDFLERAHSLYESDDIRLTQKDIQDVSFDLEDEGYAIPQVDAALSRLERAVVDKTTEYEISHRGRIVWKAQADSEYRVLLNHSQRDYKMRFDSGQSRKPSYDKKQVDNVVNKTLDKISVLLGYKPTWGNTSSDLDGIDAMFVSNVLFTQRSGKHGYDERQVDYYLNACIRLLSRLESYDRVSKYLDFDSNSAAASSVNASYSQPMPQPVQSANPMPPSIPVEHNADSSVVNPVQNIVEADSADSSVANDIFSKTTVDEVDSHHISADSVPIVEHVAGSDNSSAQHVEDMPQDRQSIFAPVDNSVDNNSGASLNDLHHGDRAIFTPHSANVEPNDDTDDEMSQASTVMPPTFPPSYAPKDSYSQNHANAVNAKDDDKNDSKSSASNPVGYLNLSLLASPKFEPSQSLNLDIPDLSFPVMNHFNPSSEDFNANNTGNNDSDDLDDTGESNFGGFVNPSHN